MNPETFYPTFDDENLDRDKTLKDTLGAEINSENLIYNADKNSFEYDVKSEDPDYDHPDPYDSTAPNGEDDNSTYDEANPYVAAAEYAPTRTLETDADQLGMHVENEDVLEPDPVDKALSHTPEDDRDDLDEEGYPKNDRS